MPPTIPLSVSMRYIAAREPGPPEVLHVAHGPLPRPKPDEVLIEVSAAGVNRPATVSMDGRSAIAFAR